MLVVGFVGVAWFLGSAAASADERGGADTPAPARGVAESASEAVGSDAGRAAEQPAAEPARSANEAATSVNKSTPSPAEAAQSSPAPDVSAAAEHNTGIDAADEVSDTVEQGARATERATERSAESGDTDDDARSAGDSRVERTGSAGDSAPDPGERPRKNQWDARNSAAHSHSPAAATAVGDSAESANPTEKDGPDRGGAPATSPISSAPQAHSGTTVPVPAGFLPAASVAPPETGMHEPPRHALTMVPQDPADEPTVSPD